MYLSRIDLIGFKTFARKTAVVFPAPGVGEGAKPLTVIVGPNGSGKSNIADAIRWCLGEQSLKMVRGKQSEDVIFSGGDGASRSGFAEVTMTFVNDDGRLGEGAEVAITRRVYRDGEGEYLLNGEPTRLSDLQLLLSEAGVAQKSYAVIGQGMIDSVLLSSPEERKVFFDEATGVRALYLRRTQAVNKLQRAETNLAEGRRILSELEPRWQLLHRAMERLQRRAQIEERLAEVIVRYFGGRQRAAQHAVAQAAERFALAEGAAQRADAAYQAIDGELSTFLAAARRAEAAVQAKAAARLEEYRALQGVVRAAEQALTQAQHAVALARATAKAAWAPLPYDELIRAFDALMDDVGRGVVGADLLERMRVLRKRLVKPEDGEVVIDAALEQAVTAAEGALTAEKARLAAWEQEGKNVVDGDVAPGVDGRDIQERLRGARLEVQQAQAAFAQARLDRSLADEALATVRREVVEQVVGYAATIETFAEILSLEDLEKLGREYRSLQREAASLGALDPETEREYAEVTERVHFYRAQIDDLTSAIAQTSDVLRSLDREIKQKGDSAFTDLAAAFRKAFVELFGGGSARLVLQEGREEDGETLPAGVEIEATPPGKTLKSLALLSGGERALTALALLMAIMETNPAPFILLDEVDAALDEANTRRFAGLLAKLRQKTQFLVITHNRATMEVADALYGVTMGRDGVSRLLSVTLSDYAEHATARR